MTPRAHVVLVQEEHGAPHGLKPMVLSIEWEVLFDGILLCPLWCGWMEDAVDIAKER